MPPHATLILYYVLLIPCIACTEAGGEGSTISESPPKVWYVDLANVATRKNSSAISIALTQRRGEGWADVTLVDSECGQRQEDFRPSDEQSKKAAELLNIRQLFKLNFLATWAEPGITCFGRAYDPERGTLVPAEVPEGLDCARFEDVQQSPPPVSYYCPESCEVGGSDLSCPAQPLAEKGTRLIKHLDPNAPLGSQVFALDPNSSDPDVQAVFDFFAALWEQAPTPIRYVSPPSGYERPSSSVGNGVHDATSDGDNLDGGALDTTVADGASD
jgi:hypothetical protein